MVSLTFCTETLLSDAPLLSGCLVQMALQYDYQNQTHLMIWYKGSAHAKPIWKEFETGSVCLAQTDLDQTLFAWCNSIIFAHTTKNGSIAFVLDWWVHDHVQLKPIPNEQCECKWFLETSSLKLISVNWFKQTGLKTVSVWTPWLRDRTKPSNFMHTHMQCTKHTHKGMHTRYTQTHTPPVLRACCVREAGLSPDSKVGCAATIEGTAVEWGTQGEGHYGDCHSGASVWRGNVINKCKMIEVCHP